MLRTSSATKLSKNLLLLIDMAEVDKIHVSGSHCKDKTVERLPSKNSNEVTGYLTSKARSTFTQLRKVFTKAPILQHFNPKYYIRIKTDVSGYVISGMLSQLINLGQ